MAVDPLDGFEPPKSQGGGKYQAYYESKERRAKFLDIIKTNPGITNADALAKVGVSVSAYEKWRQKYPQWAFEVSAARGVAPEKLAAGWSGGFAAFRKHFFGFDSPWFHLEVVDALENSPPLSVTLILLPPGHGKTSLLEDWCNEKLAQDPTFRIGYASERIAHSKKVLGRIKARMEQNGPSREYVNRYGPFAPPIGKKSNQPWGSEFFNVLKKGGDDERDYNFVALGYGAAVQGSRFDLVIVDDVQSFKSLNQTEGIVETIRQDWFTRTFGNEPPGRVVIIGTRVGEDDVYQALMDEEDENGNPMLHRVIKHPAVTQDFDTGEPKYLWPERYTPDMYDRMKAMAGPIAWARNFQQQPIVKGSITFDDEVLNHAIDPLHSWEMPIPNDVRELAITIDPALGGQNAITVQGWAPDRMVVLDSSGKWGLTSTEQILTEASNLLSLWAGRVREDGSKLQFTTMVIEEAAFQRSLVHDERLDLLKKQYGFAVIAHQTGHNKNDPDLGVSGMVYGMYQGQIMFPGAGDDFTRLRIGTVVDEFRAWRPGRRGTKLKQDKVMAVWFGWLIWRNRRHTLIDPLSRGDASPFKTEALPWKAMPRVPLFTNKVASPFRRPINRKKVPS